MADEAIYIHSMFRTGSTFLASKFFSDDNYMVFYEPFHGALSSKRRLAALLDNYETMRIALKHEQIEGGYWAPFIRSDPKTARKLHEFSRFRFPVHDVLNDLSASAVEYLNACLRTADAAGQAAVFKFCRSGLQVASMRSRLPGKHVYLFRDPRYQFASYKPGSNDYFIPQTLLQLLASRSLAPVALELCHLPRALPGVVRTASLAVPPRAVSKLGRKLSRRLSIEMSYALFYLNWLACVEHGRAHCSFSFSLMEAFNSADMKKSVEEYIGVKLAGLRRIDQKHQRTDIDHRSIERNVENVVCNLRTH